MNASKIKKILPIIMCALLLAGCIENNIDPSSSSSSLASRRGASSQGGGEESGSGAESGDIESSSSKSSGLQSNNKGNNVGGNSYESNTAGSSQYESSSAGNSQTEGTSKVNSSSKADLSSSGNQNAGSKKQVFSALKRGINFSSGLEGADLADYNSWIFDAKYYQLVKSKGFDHIRLPVTFVSKTGNAPDYIVDGEFFHQIDIAINLALESGLVVILDFHGFSAMNTDADGNKEKFYKIWDQIAKRYQRYPETLLFEVLNEPDGTGGKTGPSVLTTAKLNEIQLETIRIIRRSNPTRKIVTTVQGNNGTWNIWSMTLPEDDENLIVTVHNYATMAYTHQGTTWNNPNWNYKVPFDDTVKKEIIKSLDQAQDYQERTGRTVWVGEWGVYLGIADPADAILYADFFSKAAEERNIGWCWWEFSVGFGIYDMTKDDWKPGMVDVLVD